MKGFDVVIYVTVTVILLIVTGYVFNRFFTGTVQPAGYTPPQIKVECKSQSVCSRNNNGFLCMSITGESFCGCLNELTHCASGRKCIENRCI